MKNLIALICLLPLLASAQGTQRNEFTTNLNAAARAAALSAAAPITNSPVPAANVVIQSPLTNQVYGSNVVGTVSSSNVIGTLTLSNVPNGVLIVDAYENFSSYALGAAPSINSGYGWLTTGAVSNATVLTKTFLNGSNNCLSLTNVGYYTRRLGISNNWTELRIAVSFTITNNTTSTITNALWSIGVSSSSGAGYEGFLAGTTSNFVGYVSSTDNTNGATLTYSDNSAFPLLSKPDRGVFVALQSGVSTNKGTLSAGGVGNTMPYNVAPFRRTMVVLTIRKNGAGMAYWNTENTGNMWFDSDTKRLFAILQNYVGSPLTGTDATLVTSSTTPPTISEGAGRYLDSVNIMWKHPSIFSMQIWEIAVRAVY